MKINRKILVVDDDSVARDFFQVTLSRLGFEVYTASDGADALEKLKLHLPDIILLDIMMPKLNGFEVIQILKKSKEYSEFKNIPIIMLSSLDDVESKILGLEMGIEDYITKPFNFSEVLARIRNIIRQKEIAKQLIKRERRLAILESLNTNLIAFTRHVKRPFEDLSERLNKIDCSSNKDLKDFKDKFEEEYKQAMAMLSSIEDEILTIQSKGNKMKEEELSLEELERKINSYLDVSTK